MGVSNEWMSPANSTLMMMISSRLLSDVIVSPEQSKLVDVLELDMFPFIELYKHCSDYKLSKN